jgi:mRNA interferase MazF
VLEFLGEVTVAPVTSTIREIPSEVRLTQADGMPRECAVNLDHVQTVTRARVGPVIATVSPGKMSEVRTALLFALGFEYLTIPATVQAILAARIDRLGPRPSGRL